MRTRSQSNRRNQTRERSSDSSDSAAASPLQQEPASRAGVNAVPLRTAREHVGDSRPTPAADQNGAPAPQTVHIAGQDINLTPEMVSLLEAILGQARRQAPAPQENNPSAPKENHRPAATGPSPSEAANPGPVAP